MYQSLFEGGHAYPLFDMSGGNGVLPNTWPQPIDKLFCGYAGGLGPENLKEQLKAIEDVVGDKEIWVDMESNIRTDDYMDMGKVHESLEIIGRYV